MRLRSYIRPVVEPLALTFMESASGVPHAATELYDSGLLPASIPNEADPFRHDRLSSPLQPLVGTLQVESVGQAVTAW